MRLMPTLVAIAAAFALAFPAAAQVRQSAYDQGQATVQTPTSGTSTVRGSTTSGETRGVFLVDPATGTPYVASGGGGGGGGGNAAAGLTGSAPPTSASYTGFLGSSGTLLGASPTAQFPASPYDIFSAGNSLSSALNSSYAVSLANGQGTVAFSVTGLTASGATLAIEYSDDRGTTWSTIRNIGTAVAAGAATVTADGMFTVNGSGHTQVRLRVSVAGTGNINITSNISAATKELALGGGLPPFYAIPAFKIDQTTPGTTNAVSVTNFPTTQAVNNAQVAGAAISTGSGATDAGTQRVVLAATEPTLSISNASFGAQGAVTTGAPTYTTGTNAALSLTTAGALRIDGSGVNQPVTDANSASNLSANQATNTDLGAPGTPAATTDTGTFNLNALIQRTNSDLTTLNTTAGTLFKSGQSIGNTGFSALGSAGTALTQGSGAAGANSANIYVGGMLSAPAQAAAFNTTTPPILIGGCSTVTSSACSAGTFAPLTVSASGVALFSLSGNANNVAGSATIADGQALTSRLSGAALGQVYNGTTVDMDRSLEGVTNAALAAGTQKGLQATVPIGFVGYTDSTAALTGGATFTGTGRAAPVWSAYFQCKAYSDQGGTLTAQQSDNSGTSYYPIATATITAAAAAAFARGSLTGATATTLYRCVVLNGATAETTLSATSAFAAH